MQWIPRIQKALDDDRLCLYAQKIVPLDSNQGDAGFAELLVRLIDENNSEVLPSAFMPAAERFGLMATVDRWVVNKSLQMYSAGAMDFAMITINLSGQSLSDPDFLDYLVEKINRADVNPYQLCFEVTETAAIGNLANAIRLITTVKNLGCRFALDDFGSGLSSFTYLKSLPVDFLKIEGSFVRDMDADPVDRAMVESINSIGKVMGISTIAEFVESEAVVQYLREIGVDYGQGYALGRPRRIDSRAGGE